jgi:hypothetical protein
LGVTIRLSGGGSAHRVDHLVKWYVRSANCIRAFCLPSCFLTKIYVNRRRTRPCPVLEASLGRRHSLRSTWRGRSRPRIQACEDALLRRSDQYRSSKLATARHGSCAVQVLWNMRRMSVPGTGPSNYISVRAEPHCAHLSCIDDILRDATRSQTQSGCECLPELFQFAPCYFPPLLER